MTIRTLPPGCVCPTACSKALHAVVLLDERNEVDNSVQWTPCARCDCVHSVKKPCSRFWKVMHCLFLPLRIGRHISHDLLVFLSLYLALTTVAVLLGILYANVIYPSFMSASNATQLPIGSAQSSFVFTRGDHVYVARVEVQPCDPEPQTIQINTLRWSPPAVSLGSPIFLNLSAEVRSFIEAPVEVSVEVSKFVFITWVSVPCIDGIGSCTYNDICALAAEAQPCPQLPANFHVPCQCPVKPGEYFIDDGEVQLPDAGMIPEWLERGFYKIAVKVRNPIVNEELACYQGQIELR